MHRNGFQNRGCRERVVRLTLVPHYPGKDYYNNDYRDNKHQLPESYF